MLSWSLALYTKVTHLHYWHQIKSMLGKQDYLSILTLSARASGRCHLWSYLTSLLQRWTPIKQWCCWRRIDLFRKSGFGVRAEANVLTDATEKTCGLPSAVNSGPFFLMSDIPGKKVKQKRGWNRQNKNEQNLRFFPCGVYYQIKLTFPFIFHKAVNFL